MAPKRSKSSSLGPADVLSGVAEGLRTRDSFKDGELILGGPGRPGALRRKRQEGKRKQRQQERKGREPSSAAKLLMGRSGKPVSLWHFVTAAEGSLAC